MWLKYLVIAVCLHCVYCKNVGETCAINNQLEGVCTQLSKCEPATTAIKNKQYNQFPRCGFSGSEEIVCCPRPQNQLGNRIGQTGKSPRPAERECQKIINSYEPSLSYYIVGGEEADLGEFPHMVAIALDVGNGSVFHCGGTVLSSTYVLTAAHCVDTLDPKLPIIIRAGSIDIGNAKWNPKTDVKAAQKFIHPQYNRELKYNDLALVKLSTPLKFSSNLNAICLETSDADPKGELTITGWGKTSTKGMSSDVLLKANIISVPSTTCAKSYTTFQKQLPRGITLELLCAGDPQGNKDACQGDSGGPLIVPGKEGRSRLVGVTAFGRGCGSVHPGVYTRISRYLNWIEGIVWPN